ncbi:MAG: response regulator transcription factor [Planctomycetes bacterium]|nr:response regulator transcription factor [Planctomycetota bacterium]MCB9903303.1 response regulator transcription factor [Planctomycetota bacterium]
MSASKPVVLVVEDDPAIRRGLTDSLRFAGYQVIETGDGLEAQRILRGTDLELVLLDVALPGRTGFELLTELRDSRPTLPVIMVTARGAEEDRVRGLRSGADDYVVKPFSSSELLARVEAVLRRSAERPTGVRTIVIADLEIDLERREVRNGSAPRQLSEREADILRYLARHRGRAVAREELLQRVWGLDTRGIETRTIDMHVARLREKLGEQGGANKLIVTVRAKGYMLAEDAEVAEQ